MDVLSFPLPPLIAISLAVVILTVLVIRSRARRLGAEKKKRYHPVVTNFLNTLVNFPRLHHYMTEFEHKHKTYRAYNVLIDYVVTTDPANVEYILKTNFANYGKGWYHYGILSDLLGDGIFAVDGEKWLHQKKVSSNELTTKIVKDFSSTVFKTNAVKLARIISEAATCNKAIEIQELFMKATLDSIVKILLGIELDTMDGTNEEGTRFAHAFDVANEMTIYRYVDFSWKIKRFLNIGSEALLRKNIKVIDQFVCNLIKIKIETDNSSEDELLAVKKQDIISRLLESQETDPNILIYKKRLHKKLERQQIWKIVHALIDEVAASLTEEALEKMQYLHAALSETLRLYPAVPLNAKVCLADDTWPDGFSVKKGNFVGYHVYGMGRMKYLWGDDAKEFRPERWLNENGLFQQESPFKFTAFNLYGKAIDTTKWFLSPSPLSPLRVVMDFSFHSHGNKCSTGKFSYSYSQLGTEKKKRYHPVVTTCLHTLVNFSRLHD
nr:cytochrome P450 704C1-like [Malus domestica]